MFMNEENLNKKKKEPKGFTEASKLWGHHGVLGLSCGKMEVGIISDYAGT